jgi:DNA repair photolyase
LRETEHGRDGDAARAAPRARHPAQPGQPLRTARGGRSTRGDGRRRAAGGAGTQFLRDHTRGILATNDSPDVPFDVSLNPYRGCEHGCVYCFARPTHEYLGFSAGLDFETRILVKHDAPELLRHGAGLAALGRRGRSRSRGHRPVPAGGAAAPLTRGCLEVLAEFRNPVAVVTKSHLVTRDADLLAELAGHGAAVVNLSLTTLDEAVQRVMEPRASTPARRLDAIAGSRRPASRCGCWWRR